MTRQRSFSLTAVGAQVERRQIHAETAADAVKKYRNTLTGPALGAAHYVHVACGGMPDLYFPALGPAVAFPPPRPRGNEHWWAQPRPHLPGFDKHKLFVVLLEGDQEDAGGAARFVHVAGGGNDVLGVRDFYFVAPILPPAPPPLPKAQAAKAESGPAEGDVLALSALVPAKRGRPRGQKVGPRKRVLVPRVKSV